MISALSPVGPAHVILGETNDGGSLVLKEVEARSLTVIAGRGGAWARGQLTPEAVSIELSVPEHPPTRIRAEDEAGNAVTGFEVQASLHLHPTWTLEARTVQDTDGQNSQFRAGHLRG